MSLLLMAIAQALPGCRDELPTADPLLAEDESVPGIQSVDPSNNTSGVDPSSSYGVKFNHPMDTGSVSGNFHLVGGHGVHDWLDSLAEHHDHSGMGGGDRQHLMDWLDSMQYDGQLHWNEHLDSCEFVPDSAFISNSLHMLYITGDVRDHHGTMMYMDSTEYGGYLFFFTTSE